MENNNDKIRKVIVKFGGFKYNKGDVFKLLSTQVYYWLVRDIKDDSYFLERLFSSDNDSFWCKKEDCESCTEIYHGNKK